MAPIERAVLALGEGIYRPPGGSEIIIAPGWSKETIVRAVLQAIREPSEMMRLVGGYTQKFGETEDDRYAYGIWQAMIDAALEE